jgi:hypothetical protein
MSLINLDENAGKGQVTLPYYNESNFPPNVSGNSFSNAGWTVDISEDEVIVASSQPNYYASRGSKTLSTEYVYIYEKANDIWALQQTITNPGSDGDVFGFHLSLSKSNGEFLAVSTNKPATLNTVYIYQSNLSSPPTYSLVQTINVSADNFGFRVQLNAAGDVLNAVNRLGVYDQYSTSNDWSTFGNIFTVSTPLTSNATDAEIGFNAAFDLNTAIRGLSIFPTTGAASVATGRVDIIKSGIVAQSFTGGSAGARIGGAVAISENGLYIAFSETNVAVMNTNEEFTTGKVHIYVLTGPIYTFQQTLDPSDVNATAVAISGSFGSSLKLNTTGNFLVVADTFSTNLQGDCYIFERTDDDWTLEQNTFASIQSNSATIVLNTSNNSITTNIAGAGDVTVNATVGSYDGFELAAALQTALLSGSSNWTVTFSYITGFYTIANSSIFTVEIDPLPAILGFTLRLIDASSYTSTQIADGVAFTGSLVGNSLAISNATVSTIVVGKPGYNVSEGQLTICELSTTSIVRDERLIIDANDNTALGVRKDNDNGYVLEVDTINDQIRVTGDLFIDGNVSITLAILNVDDITGTNGITVTGGTSPGNNLFLQSTTNTIKGSVIINETTTSSSSTTGGFVVNGGMGVKNDIFSSDNNITQLANQNIITLPEQTLGTSNWYAVDSTSISTLPVTCRAMIWSKRQGLFYWVGGGLTGENTSVRVSTSSDGISWTANDTHPATSGKPIASLIYSEETDTFVMPRTGPTLTHSVGGTTWTNATVDDLNWVGGAYSPSLDRFVLINNEGSGTDQFIYSDDSGVNWTNATTTPTVGNVDYRAVVWSPQLNIFSVVGGQGVNNMAYSSDGINWTVAVTEDGANLEPRGVTWSPLLAKFCSCLASTSSAGGQSMTSVDGINWVLGTAFPGATVVTTAIVWCEGLELFVIISSNGASRVFTSPDGVTWTAIAPATSLAYAVMVYSPQIKSILICQSTSGYFGADYNHSFLAEPGALNTIFAHPAELYYNQSTKTLCMAVGTTLDIKGTLTVTGTFNPTGPITVTDATDATSATDTSASIYTAGGIACTKSLRVGTEIVTGTTVESSKGSTGTVVLADATANASIKTFTGKNFVVEVYVAVVDGTDGDLVSSYQVTGVQVNIGGTAWIISVVRVGTTTPGVTFDIVGGTGELRVTTPTFTNFSSGNLFYDVLTNILD